MTRQRADTSPKVPGIKQKDAKVALYVAVVLKLGEPYYRSQPPIKSIQTAGTGKVALRRRDQA